MRKMKTADKSVGKEQEGFRKGGGFVAHIFALVNYCRELLREGQ